MKSDDEVMVGFWEGAPFIWIVIFSAFGIEAMNPCKNSLHTRSSVPLRTVCGFLSCLTQWKSNVQHRGQIEASVMLQCIGRFLSHLTGFKSP